MSEHTEDCQGGEECQPIDGSWDQPAGYLVNLAQVQIDDDAPWCRIRVLAFEIEESEEGVANDELTAQERLLCQQHSMFFWQLGEGVRLETGTLYNMTVLLPVLVEKLNALVDQRHIEEEAMEDLEAQEYLRSHPDVVERIQAHNPDLLTEIEVPHEPPADER